MLLARKREAFVAAMAEAELIRAKYEGVKDANMTPDEEARYDQFLSEADSLKSQIAALEKHEKLDKWSREVPEDPKPIIDLITGEFKSFEEQQKDARAIKAWRAYLRAGADRNMAAERSSVMEAKEIKAYQADNPTGGGFAVTPQELVSEFLTLLKDNVYMRRVATIHQVPNAESLGVPAIDTDPSDSDWTSELNVGSEETTMALGKRELQPKPVAKYIKLSKKLLRQVPNIESVILDRLAYKMGVTQEKAYLTGTGAGQPLGVYVADSNGIPTTRDITAAGAAAITGDDVINVFYNLKAGYRQNAAWMLNRTVVSAVRKLKDSQGGYLWQPGMNGFVAQGTALIGSQPDTLLGRPIMESEFAPGTITTGLYTMLLGDFKTGYWIADALDMVIQVLFELFALTNQMGYILRAETDGMPVQSEAFSRLKQA